MAKRDPNFRKAVLEADHSECVVCGSTEALEAHHVEARGMGGMASRDTLDNGMTLCAECHREKTDGLWSIEWWDRTNKENGLAIVDNQLVKDADGGNRLPKSGLWFYLRQEREKVKEEAGLLTSLSLTAGARAMMLHHVFEYCPLLKTGQTPEEYIASLGLDSVKAREEADLAAWVVENGLTWPDGVNASKVALIRSATEWMHNDEVTVLGAMLYEEWQEWLDKARDTSYSQLEKDLAKAGRLQGGIMQKELYLQVPVETACWFYRSNLEGIPREDGYYLVRVGKVFPPLRRSRGRLLVRDGLIEKEVEVE